jgi:hypothetical protein
MQPRSYDHSPTLAFPCPAPHGAAQSTAARMTPRRRTASYARASALGRILGVTFATGCSRGAGDGEVVPVGGVGRASTIPLTAGEYTVQSAARYRGATLRLVDNRSAPIPRNSCCRGQEPLTAASRVRRALTASRCASPACVPVGQDGPGGSTRYDDVSYGGHYRVRDVGGGRLELRQLDGPAVDTVARVR